MAVSGGADSVALLRLLAELRGELGIVLSIVHVNHQLRGEESQQDACFVADLAQQLDLELHSASVDVAGKSQRNALTVEAAARELRYGYFFQLLRDGAADRIATGHTLDDQAETVLMRIARGAGTKGLAGIYPELTVPDHPQKSVIRPLLTIRRKDLEAYLTAIGQDWREDSSNRDQHFTRNRVRHEILPRMEESLNPRIREALAETAEIARAEEDYWHREVETLLPQVLGTASLDLKALLAQPQALQRRLVRAAGKKFGLNLEFAHVEEVLAVAAAHDRLHSCMLPHGWSAVRASKCVQLVAPQAASQKQAGYEYIIPVPGSVEVPELAASVEAVPVDLTNVLAEGRAAYNPEQLYAPRSLSKELVVRNWRPGDRFWPAHTKAPRKIKELLQERKVAQMERGRWPVAVCGEEVIWMRGFAAPARCRPSSRDGEAILIREVTGPADYCRRGAPQT